MLKSDHNNVYAQHARSTNKKEFKFDPTERGKFQNFHRKQ